MKRAKQAAKEAEKREAAERGAVSRAVVDRASHRRRTRSLRIGAVLGGVADAMAPPHAGGWDPEVIVEADG